jgi:recombinational DNA repair protein RecR
MLKCKTCTKEKRANNCRECAEKAFKQRDKMIAIVKADMNDGRKMEKLIHLLKTEYPENMFSV